MPARYLIQFQPGLSLRRIFWCTPRVTALTAVSDGIFSEPQCAVRLEFRLSVSTAYNTEIYIQRSVFLSAVTHAQNTSITSMTRLPSFGARRCIGLARLTVPQAFFSPNAEGIQPYFCEIWPVFEPTGSCSCMKVSFATTSVNVGRCSGSCAQCPVPSTP
jgi:hypothetical protein